MALRFRLRGLAETFLDEACCPDCGIRESDDRNFSTELTRVTFEGIIVVLQCRNCGEIFVPDGQRLGVLNPSELKVAVEKDSRETGEPLLSNQESVKLNVERMNATRRGAVH